MTKHDSTKRPSPKRRSDGPSETRDDRRAGSGSDKRHASGSGSDKRPASGSGRPSSRPAGPSAGARGDERRPRRDGDQKPARPAGASGEKRERTDDQKRPRYDNDHRPARPAGPRGDARDRDSDQKRPRRDGEQRPARATGPRGDSRDRDSDQKRPRSDSEQRPRRDGDQRPERQSDRRDGYGGKPEKDRQPRYDADRRHGERPGGEDAPRVAHSRAEAVPLPEDILPGRKPVRELIEQSPQSVDDVILRQGLRGADVDAIVAACTAAGVRYRFMPTGDMDRIYPGNHQGFLARLAAGDLASLDDVLAATKAAPLPVSLALDRVQDPGNVGTLARTLFALGGGGLIVPKHEGARLGPGAAKASAGTLARLPVAKVSNLSRALDEAAEAGFTIVGAAGEANAQNIYTAAPAFPIILVLGSEDEGIRAGVAKRCQAMLRIPQARPLDSINVAQAGAIILGRLASLLDQGS
ncbi:MAG: TrmH family RNA methyltransferase [Acidobacteriota bacterium]